MKTIKGRTFLLDEYMQMGWINPPAGTKLPQSTTSLNADGSRGSEKIYKLATIDFMLNGGDKVYALQKCENVIETNIVMRDAVIRYFKEKEAAGELVDSDCDGRVVIEK
mgnify:CR=1 FL=1